MIPIIRRQFILLIILREITRLFNQTATYGERYFLLFRVSKSMTPTALSQGATEGCMYHSEEESQDNTWI